MITGGGLLAVVGVSHCWCYHQEFLAFVGVITNKGIASANFKRKRKHQQGQKIKLYPNSNNGTMNFIYSLDKSSKGEFDLFDFTGSLVKKYPLQIGENNQLIISETELSNGIYLYKVVIDGALKASDKIVIIK